MRTSVSLILSIFCLLGSAPLPAQETAELKEELLGLAKLISNQAATARRTAIEGLLDQAKIPYARQPYLVNNKGEGINIEVRLGAKEGAALVLCAHHDSRAGSKGANDDAAGCAVLIQICKELQRTSSLRRPVILLFLDGSNKGLVGTEGWAEFHRQEAVDRVLVFDLCGRGDQLLVGSAINPLANSAPQLLPEATVLAGDLPTDHKQFARFGLDASFVVTCPASALEALRQRYEARDFKAQLPEFITETIRGRDSADLLESEALELSFRAGLKAVELAQVGPAFATKPNPEFLSQTKLFDVALGETDFKKVQELAAQVGFNGLLAVLSKGQESPEYKSKMATALRLIAGKELRTVLEQLGEKPDVALAKIAQLKPRLVLKEGHFSLAPG